MSRCGSGTSSTPASHASVPHSQQDDFGGLLDQARRGPRASAHTGCARDLCAADRYSVTAPHRNRGAWAAVAARTWQVRVSCQRAAKPANERSGLAGLTTDLRDGWLRPTSYRGPGSGRAAQPARITGWTGPRDVWTGARLGIPRPLPPWQISGLSFSCRTSVPRGGN